MYLSKSVEVDVHIEVEVDDVLEFIDSADTKDFNKIKEKFQITEFRSSTLHGTYYEELIEKLVKSGKHPFEVEKKLIELGILSV